MYCLIAPAKINLFLQIVGSYLPDPRYHELVMVMQAVTLADGINLTPLSQEVIVLTCDHPQVPTNSMNLAYKAAALMQSQFPGHGGVEIHIDKRIPIGAGLAGGSTDAAAVLVGLDLLWDLGLTQGELQGLGGQLGADVPFCIGGGTALALGRGDDLTPLPDLDHVVLLLGKFTNISVSTPWAYQTYRQTYGASYAQTVAQQEQKRQQDGSRELLQALSQKNIPTLAQALHNDFEAIVLPEYPLVAQLRQAFIDAGAMAAMMSGSGPTVFAIAESQVQAEMIKTQVQGQFADQGLDIWLAQTCPHGVRLVAQA
ncbi:4-(cytidine 5'-diphospho)-2-C-methyl-D-erythritol kinase [Synechococcus sp. PCC 6312]|uniref:4-(cytidine 5'-diphospho)-2-C-methyl-D-erythritol kinase n=1 Tax=Synechococcus sp. (strain ATCC 27167 / PCC 6312) TaxID=195253 RepID=UPI00029F4213|nr:4-(cytidine 5'-diphospho)-2-C-methyl-D-erythritol kinase [Synechococcus sp. PCC 6312]AFY60502.1 4-diphosphocytidyl-2-C-methyl-D-erythritol kinase [Synechococcus sp. PCC 6312]